MFHWQPLAAFLVAAAAPSITDVDEDNTLTLSQANVEIDGTDFDTATVELRQGAFEYAASIDSQNATAIVFDMPDNTLAVAPKHGAATVAVINGDDQEDTQAITINPDAGTDYVDVGTPNADPDIRVTGSDDAVSGDQCQWGNVQGTAVDETDVIVNDDLTWDASEAVTAFDVRFWDQADSFWGAWATQEINGEEDDTTPNAFSFTDQSGVATSTVITSAPVTITGINTTVPFTADGGTIDVNGDNDFQTSRDVVNNDQIRAQHTSSASYLTATNTVVTGGGVSGTFTSTTRTEPAGEGGGIHAPVRQGGMLIFG